MISNEVYVGEGLEKDCGIVTKVSFKEMAMCARKPLEGENLGCESNSPVADLNNTVYKGIK